MSGDLRRRMDRLEVANGVENQDWLLVHLGAMAGDDSATARIDAARASGKSRSFNAWEAGMDELLAQVAARRASEGLPPLDDAACEGMGGA